MPAILLYRINTTMQCASEQMSIMVLLMEIKLKFANPLFMN